MAAKKRIFVIETEPIFTLGMRKAIEDDGTYIFCGQSSDARKSIDLFPRAKPDLITIDLALANAAGTHILAELRACRPDAAILVTIRDMDPVFVRRAKRAGAQGVFSKSQSAQEFLNSAHKLLQGEKSFAIHPDKKSPKGKAQKQPQDILTSRELEIFEMLGRGLGTRRIAETLAVSPKTVDSHCANLKAKLGSRTGSELVKKAVIWVTMRGG